MDIFPLGDSYDTIYLNKQPLSNTLSSSNWAHIVLRTQYWSILIKCKSYESYSQSVSCSLYKSLKDNYKIVRLPNSLVITAMESHCGLQHGYNRTHVSGFSLGCFDHNLFCLAAITLAQWKHTPIAARWSVGSLAVFNPFTVLITAVLIKSTHVDHVFVGLL